MGQLVKRRLSLYFTFPIGNREMNYAAQIRPVKRRSLFLGRQAGLPPMGISSASTDR